MRFSTYLAGPSAVAALCLAACSGGGGGGVPGPSPTGSYTPVLVPGTVAQYSGTDTVAHVFPNPQGTQTNYTAGYTFTTTRSVEAGVAGAPAAFDINAKTTYAVTQDPGQGVARGSATTDTFENQSAAPGGTLVQSVGSTSVSVGTDESAGLGGGGPFTETNTTNTRYATAQTVGTYPLVTGTTIAEPIGRTVTETTSDANGGVSDTYTTFTTSSTDTVNADGSYSLAEQLSNGESQTIVEQSNGSGTVSASGPVYTLSDSIGVPSNPGTGYVIPVTTLRQNATTGATPAPVATTSAYSAADWYPGGALPVSPFQTSTVTVKGPAATLPAACAGAIAEPGVIEVDSSDATLNIDASYATTTQQRFDSGTTPVCVLRTVTTNAYALTTGLPSQITTETYAQVLTSLANSASSRALGPSSKT